MVIILYPIKEGVKSYEKQWRYSLVLKTKRLYYDK